MIVRLLKERGECFRKRSPSPPIIIKPKSLRGNYDWQDLGGIRAYIVYRIDVKNRGFNREISDNRGMTSRSRGGCLIYHIYLCRKGDCVKRFYKWDNAI